MRALVVEDDPAILGFLVRGLTEEGFAVDQATDGEEARIKAAASAYNCIILDLTLPAKDGLQVLRELRSAGIETPVVVLTARDGVSDRIRGLDTGADDYLVKPFSFEELLARLRAVMRRRLATSAHLKVGPLSFDRPARIVRWGDSRLELSIREYAILELLAQHPGEVLTRTRILEQVWNEQTEIASNVIDVHIKQIRRKLTDAGATEAIETVRGAGYRLSMEPR